MSFEKTKIVTIIIANIKQYRAPFLLKLKESLADDNVALNIIYSDPDSIENLKNDSVNLPKDTAIKVPRFYFCNNRILLQIIPIRKIIESDLIIIIQASGYLANYFLYQMFSFY